MRVRGATPAQTHPVDPSRQPCGSWSRTASHCYVRTFPRPAKVAGFTVVSFATIADKRPPLSRYGSRLAILVYQGSDPTQPYPTLVIRDRAPHFLSRLCADGHATTLFGHRQDYRS